MPVNVRPSTVRQDDETALLNATVLATQKDGSINAGNAGIAPWARSGCSRQMCRSVVNEHLQAIRLSSYY